MIDSALKSVFGHESFRANQREIVEATLGGRDVLGILPTGGGKSLCYMLPAYLMEGTTVVITPLVSLMQDQVRRVEAIGLEAAMINCAMPGPQARVALRRAGAGRLKLLYIAPERLAAPGFLDLLRSMKIASFVIDEAHCISEWGAEFRPIYTKIAGLISGFNVPVSAYTATATSRTKQDIIEKTGLCDPMVVTASFDRPNLWYGIVQKDCENEIEQISNIVWKSDGPGIIYRCTRYAVESTCRKLIGAGFNCLPYHAGLDGLARDRNQESFLSGQTEIVVATIAFGMGIDKPNVRWVIHADIPKTLESYYQETGRAGRDELPSQCTFLFSKQDIPLTRSLIDKAINPEYRAFSYQQFLKVLAFASTEKCRRQQILAYFGQEHDGNCGNCDVCSRKV